MRNFVLSVVILTACDGRGAVQGDGASVPDATTPPATASATASATPSASAAPSAKPSATAKPHDGRGVKVSIDDMRKQHGIAMGLSFPHPPGWIGGGLDGDSIAHSSSPPGGAGGLSVWPYEEKVHDFATLKALFGKKRSAAKIGAEDTLTIAGAKRVALVATQGESHASSAMCVVMVPSPKSAANGLVFVLTTSWHSDVVPTCEKIMKHEGLALIVSELRLET